MKVLFRVRVNGCLTEKIMESTPKRSLKEFWENLKQVLKFGEIEWLSLYESIAFIYCRACVCRHIGLMRQEIQYGKSAVLS